MKDVSPYIIGRKTGEVNVSIQFSSSIHNFKDYQAVNDHCIYNCEKYSITSTADPLRENFYTAPDLYVLDKITGEEILLENFASGWITNPERNIAIFDSKDFLEQTCITHCVWRIQESNDSIEPYNDYLREKKKRTDKIRDAILGILKPEIKKVAEKFKQKYKHIDFEDINSKALEIASIMVIGENKNHIGKTLNILNNEPDKKQKARSEFRENSIHTIKNYKNKVRNKIDLRGIKEGALKEIKKIFNPDIQLDIELKVAMLQPEHFSRFVAETLSYNSPKIYSVFNEENLKDFIFGKKGKYIPLYGYLKDYFKNDIKKYTKNTTTGNIDDLNNDDYKFINEYENISLKTRHKWKINQGNFSKEEKNNKEIIANRNLKGKLLDTYLAWLNGKYNSNNPKERQNLSRAKNKIKQEKINIPLPNSQK